MIYELRTGRDGALRIEPQVDEPAPPPGIYRIVSRVHQAMERERSRPRVLSREHSPCGQWTCLRPQCRSRQREAPHVLHRVRLDELETPAWLLAA